MSDYHAANAIVPKGSAEPSNALSPEEKRSPMVPRSVPEPPATTVLELVVRNHPGVMSHVTGLFARRAFNLEAIICVPEAGRATSRMLLLVAADPKLEQVERQIAKLYDILEVRHRPDLGATYFEALRW